MPLSAFTLTVLPGRKGFAQLRESSLSWITPTDWFDFCKIYIHVRVDSQSTSRFLGSYFYLFPIRMQI